ncbi:putative baseplate assembly protein [Haliangium sp.]|uniref:putative baseplate assembly protein n=1 Tax=Haliangium sp. TaxID=2663208 RepID=UPI003D13ABD4
MALTPAVLDDLSWSDLVAAARDSIAAASGGVWTHHAPVDPGVTLIELYAWLFDQRIYWLDQVSDSMKRAILALLGVTPRPATSARTVLALSARPEVGVMASFVIAAGAEVVHGDPEAGLRFTLDQASLWAPVSAIELLVNGRDRSQELVQGRAVAVVTAPEDDIEAGAGPNFTLRLRVGEDWPSAPAAPFGFLCELVAAPHIAPGWAAEAVDVDAPASLDWRYRGGAGELVPFPENTLDDGTGGLRRSGLVRITPPADWIREPDDGGVYAVHVIVRDDTFTAPPRVGRLVPNACVATHVRAPAPVEQSVAWLPLPGIELALASASSPSSFGDEPVLADSVELDLRERVEGWQTWRRTPDLAFHGPADRVFEVDREARALRFGDGLRGRVPRLGGEAPNLRVRCRVGGGDRGNLAAGNPWQLVDEPALVVVNPVPAAGGVDPESLDQALARAAREARRRERAVTASDYELLATKTPGVAVARAHAAVGFHPEHPCIPVPGTVTVFVVPAAPRVGTDWDDAPELWADSAHVSAPVMDPAALAAVLAQLESRRLIGAEVRVVSARYRRVALAVELLGDAFDPAAVRDQVTAALRRYLDPLVGGSAGTGWPFGGPVRPSALVRVAQAAVGTELEVSRVAIGLDGADPSEDCSDVAIGAHDLVVPAAVSVTVSASGSRRGQGGLR